MEECSRRKQNAHRHAKPKTRERDAAHVHEGGDRQRETEREGFGGGGGVEVTWKKATHPSGSGTAPPACRSNASRHLSYGAGQWSLTTWSLTGMRVNISLAGLSNVTWHLAPPSAISDHVARRDLNVSLSWRIGIIQ